MTDALTTVREDLVEFVQRRAESREVAEDIVQDVLERLYRAGAEAVDNPQAWLYRAARNAVIDHYRMRRSSDPLPDDFALEYDASSADVGPNAAVQELARCLRPLVDRLPASYRRAVTLVDLDGRTHAQAAGLEQISVSGMKSRVQRGRARLGALLAECCVVTTTASGAVSSYAPRGSDSRCC